MLVGTALLTPGSKHGRNDSMCQGPICDAGFCLHFAGSSSNAMNAPKKNAWTQARAELTARGIPNEIIKEGSQLLIRAAGKRIDFYPNRGNWSVVGAGQHGFGLNNLIRFIKGF